MSRLSTRSEERPQDRWPSEREVADEVPIDVSPVEARRILASVPVWFHTFALNRENGIYTPGKARDHGYRLASIPSSFEGLSVLDVGAFDGFYSFLAEARGADRIVAVDNEQYVDWVDGRWNVKLAGGEGFRAIRKALSSSVEYRRSDAFALERSADRFDFVFCFGLLHRVENPLGLLRVLTGCLRPAGRLLIETYGIVGDGGGESVVYVPRKGEVYPRDDFVHWQFSSGGLASLVALTERPTFDVHRTVMVDGHPRVIGVVS